MPIDPKPNNISPIKNPYLESCYKYVDELEGTNPDGVRIKGAKVLEYRSLESLTAELHPDFIAQDKDKNSVKAEAALNEIIRRLNRGDARLVTSPDGSRRFEDVPPLLNRGEIKQVFVALEKLANVSSPLGERCREVIDGAERWKSDPNITNATEQAKRFLVNSTKHLQNSGDPFMGSIPSESMYDKLLNDSVKEHDERTENESNHLGPPPVILPLTSNPHNSINNQFSTILGSSNTSLNNNTIVPPPPNITPKFESPIVKSSNIDNTLDIHHQNTNHLANTLPPLPILSNQTQPNPNTSNVLLTNSYVQKLLDAPQETQNQDQRLPQLTPPPAPTTTNPVDPSKSSNLQPVNLNLLNQKEEVQIPLLNTPFDGTHPLTTVPTDTPNNITNKHTYTPPVYTNKFVAPINNTPILLENLLTSSKTGKTIEGIVTLEDGRKVVSKQKCIYSTKNPDLNPTPLATVTIYATPGYFSSTKQKYPFLDINSDEEINNKINDYLTQFNSNSNFNSNSIHLFKDKTDIDGNKKSVYGMLILQGGTPYIIGYGDRKLACKYADKLKKREDWVVLSNRTGVENAIDRLLKKNPKNTHFGKILDEFDEFTKSRVDIAAPKIGNTLNLHPEAFYNEFNSWLELRERANQNLAPETNKKQDPSVRQKLPPIESKFKPQPMPEVLPVDVQWKSALRSVVYGESSIGGFTLPPDRNPAKRKMVVTKNCIYNTVSQDIHMELPYGAFVYSVSEDTIEKSGFSRAVKRIHVIRPDGPEFVICSGKLGDNMIHEDGELYFPVSSTPKLSKTAAMITNNSMIKNNVDILLESLDEIDDDKMVSKVRGLMRDFMQFLNSKSEETGSLVHPEVFYEEFNEWLGNQALE